MKTTVRNWSLVTIKDDENSFQILWAIVEHDQRNKFKNGDYVCSSRVVSIENNCVTTKSGTCYELIGSGSEYIASYVQLISLIDGFSPVDLKLTKISETSEISTNILH